MLDIHPENNEEEFCILSKKSVIKQKVKYNFLHIRAIQVTAKPMHKLGLSNAILLNLRDGRQNKFQESIFGTVETSLIEGPIYFNCFLNMTISLRETCNGPY